MGNSTHRILVIGAGHMAQPIIRTLLLHNPTEAGSLTLITGMSPGRNKQAIWEMITRTPGRKMMEITLLNREEVERKPLDGAYDTVLYCAKPQHLKESLHGYSASIAEDATVISIAAGRSIRDIAAACGKRVSVVRAMPHLPGALFGILAESEPASAIAIKLLANLGEPVKLANEEQFHVYSSHAGSGPAFVAQFITRMQADGVTVREISGDSTSPHIRQFYRNWLTLAQRDFTNTVPGDDIVHQTIAGTLAYLENTGIPPADFSLRVRSARGMTNAGLLVMGSPPPEEASFGSPEQLQAQRELAADYGSRLKPEETIIYALLAATQRSQGIGSDAGNPLGGMDFKKVEAEAESILRRESHHPDPEHG